MKKLTKIVLTISGILFIIGVVCVLISFSMGMNGNKLNNMFMSGKFNFSGDFLEFNNGKTDMESVEIYDNIKNLDIEFGAGTLEICYGDVEQIVIEQKNVKNFETEVDGNTLFIEGGKDVGIYNNTNPSLMITLPRNMEFKNVDLSIGASEASVQNLVAEKLDIEVGAGEASITELDVDALDAKVGVGALSVTLVGKETDYSYDLECGIGSITFGDTSYSGLGNSHSVNQPGASRFLDIECGVGEAEIKFLSN